MGKGAKRVSVVVVWPHDVFARLVGPPPRQRLSANHGTKKRALDRTASQASRDSRDVAINGIDPNDVGVVTAGLDAELRSTEWRDSQRNSSLCHPIKRLAHGAGQQQPWTAWPVDRQTMLRTAPAFVTDGGALGYGDEILRHRRFFSARVRHTIVVSLACDEQ